MCTRADGEEGEEEGEEGRPGTPGDDNRSSHSKSNTPSGKKKRDQEEDGEGDQPKSRQAANVNYFSVGEGIL